MIVIGSI